MENCSQGHSLNSPTLLKKKFLCGNCLIISRWRTSTRNYLLLPLSIVAVQTSRKISFKFRLCIISSGFQQLKLMLRTTLTHRVRALIASRPTLVQRANGCQCHLMVFQVILKVNNRWIMNLILEGDFRSHQLLVHCSRTVWWDIYANVLGTQLLLMWELSALIKFHPQVLLNLWAAI